MARKLRGEDASELRARLAGDGYAHLDGSTIGGKSDDYSALITRLRSISGWPDPLAIVDIGSTVMGSESGTSDH